MTIKFENEDSRNKFFGLGEKVASKMFRIIEPTFSNNIGSYMKTPQNRLVKEGNSLKNKSKFWRKCVREKPTDPHQIGSSHLDNYA